MIDSEKPRLKRSEKPSLQRIDNNFKYHPPKEGQPKIYELIIKQGKGLALVIDYYCPDSKEKDLAITKIEEAVMWAIAAIARG